MSKKKRKKSAVNNNNNNRKQQEAPKKKINFLLIIAGVAAAASIAVVILVNNNGASNENDNSRENAVTVSSGESLIIPTAGITSTASFFPIEVDGTAMEVLAVRASDGTVRTAFNTCQSCYTSGRGYYVQEGSDLVCQNCGFHFTPDEVEITAGGCNPWPIFTENKTVTDDEISILYDFLTQARSIFANWKVQY